MTTLVFDLFDITHASSQRDAIAIRAPKIRPATTRAGVVLDRWVTVAAPGDDETVEVEPGPAEIKFGRGSDAPVVGVMIPDVPQVRLSDLLDQGAVVEPTVVDRLWAAIRAGGEPEALAELAERVGVLEQREPTPDLEALTKRVEALEAAHTEPDPYANAPTLKVTDGGVLYNMFRFFAGKELGIFDGDASDITDWDAWGNEELWALGRETIRSLDAQVKQWEYLPFIPDVTGVESLSYAFNEMISLKAMPPLDTSSVTDMAYMFGSCFQLQHVPDLNTSQVTDMSNMFVGCANLTDGNVRLIGKHPDVDTTNMILHSGLTREPFYDTEGNPIN